MIPKHVVEICEAILRDYGRQGMLVVLAKPHGDHMETAFQLFYYGPADPAFLMATALTGIRDVFKQQDIEVSLTEIAEEALRVARLEQCTTTRIIGERIDQEEEDE